MEMTYSLKPAIEELERGYQFFNQELFSGSLDSKIIITIQTSGRKNALGWHWGNKWKNGSKSSIAEINLSAETLKASDPYETLIHEMAHHWNYQRGIKDVSRGQYHNKKFKEAAENAGLKVERFGNVGFGVTELGEVAKQAILKFKPQKEVFEILRRQEISAKVQKLKKWSCECGVSIRSGRSDLDISCNICGSIFQLNEG